jgi:hypothetical protein
LAYTFFGKTFPHFGKNREKEKGNSVVGVMFCQIEEKLPKMSFSLFYFILF